MVARKKLLTDDVPEDPVLRAALETAAPSKSARQAMRKDAHLIEAALEADLVVISADNTAYGLFLAASAQVVPIKKISWMNPAAAEDGLANWLAHGASATK
jgi:hypothetical protein